MIVSRDIDVQSQNMKPGLGPSWPQPRQVDLIFTFVVPSDGPVKFGQGMSGGPKFTVVLSTICCSAWLIMAYYAVFLPMLGHIWC